MKNLLLKPPPLFVGEVHRLPEAGFDLVIHVDGEVFALRTLESAPEVTELAIGLLQGTPKSIEGLSGF